MHCHLLQNVLSIETFVLWAPYLHTQIYWNARIEKFGVVMHPWILPYTPGIPGSLSWDDELAWQQVCDVGVAARTSGSKEG